MKPTNSDRPTDLPPSSTWTPEQALAAVQKMDLERVLIVAYDRDGKLIIRTSRMSRAEALWLAKSAESRALDV